MKKVMFRLILSLTVALSLTCASRNNLETEKAAVKKVIEDAYMNGLFPKLNVEAVKKGYHKDCSFISYSFIGIVKRSMDEWLDYIIKNHSEPEEGEVTHKFLSLTVTNRTASAVMETHIAGRREITTNLTLYKLKEGWKIVSDVIYWHGFDVPKDRKTVNLDPALYDALTGRYVTGNGLEFVVSKTGDQLFIQMQIPKHPKLELFPQSETVYFNKDINVTVTFAGGASPTPKGKMTQLVFRTGPTGHWDLVARRMIPKVAVFSGKIQHFKMSEVVAGPFDSQESAMKKYGNQLPDDLEIAPASPKGMVKGWFLLKAEPIVSTKDLESVNRGTSPHGEPAISISLKPESAEKMKAYTTANQGKRLAIMLDNQVISAPVIGSVISKDSMITGHFTTDEVSELIIQLKIAINKNQ
ncbi:MAG: hypothetical protein GTO45_09690 [Candidatus Aminicenantes bacterium]|nr:hypothetical protein [Candidatus Aminicenantes bacterium]NIM79087.1 hypothetical protein [Candidatus Aminicenantes bacterium]NIN18366.1 hypothetical protein [Candidatus Aminicenantes bacterium]NIN42253.1 hypothetical protein [Candidatus Aminicenantes bacterium]NIN85019.1 hypothetical protein [Candidatus Aminicenantes bacterium]